MARIKAFYGIRPTKEKAREVSALPYDVYSRKEAYEFVKTNPQSFLAIDRGETLLDEGVDMYGEEAYQSSKLELKKRIEQGIFIKEDRPCIYLYELTMEGRSQTGIVACASIDDYLGNVIKKHENTRQEKEKDRIRHIDVCSTQTGPIFLAYRKNEKVERIVETEKKKEALYDFVTEDGIGHRVWKIEEEKIIEKLAELFDGIENLYIADGHHRAASAVKVGLKRREKYPDYTGQEEFNFFLSVIFPDDQLHIMDYNRVVKDLGGQSEEAFLKGLEESFIVTRVTEAVSPKHKGEFGMYLKDTWYRLVLKEECKLTDRVKSLDVSYLQDLVLAPILGIKNPKTDKRIDFVGGIRGLKELEKRVKGGYALAFSMYPTSMEELFSVADKNLLMPPKSTWFEPKLRSGLFLHEIEE